MSEPKRLHPIAAILNVLKILKELIIPFLLFVVFGSKGFSFELLPFLIAGVVVLLIIVSAIISWFRYTYRIEEGELRIEHGLFVRNKRYIPFERIQSLDLSEGIIHRPFGLVKVKVETAGSSGLEAEAVLTAITKEAASEIQDILQKNRASGRPNSEMETEEFPERKEEIIYKITMKELILLASTSGGIGVVISAVFAFIVQFEELIPYETVFHEIEEIISSGVILVSILIFIGFVLAWLVAVLGMLLKYGNFTLKKVDDDLIVTRGLLEKRQLTIPLKRIQGIRISENLIRQPLGYASVFIESAGGSVGDTDGASANILPFIKKNRIREIIENNIPGYIFTDEITPAPKRALKRYLFRGTIIVVPILVIFLFFFQLWGLLTLILLPIFAGWAYLCYRDAGWKQEDNQLKLSFRTIGKNTVLMQRNKIQSLSMKESVFQKKEDLASVEATIMSGFAGAGGRVVDLEEEEVLQIYHWYSRNEKSAE
ncbi:PH domain-containing protein [Robertmurraya massiliosenegalensis]|uniref:PH domain-containing protein n=1 Tax=Robertmurraya massiliosenegalensis TaxID=1287657 RepID=UPI0003168E79|nr:PH domain-containing protein [Robertmurraya massiliosenegalensis]